jgi:hypothetical protein
VSLLSFLSWLNTPHPLNHIILPTRFTLISSPSGFASLAGLRLDVKDDEEGDGDESAEEHGQVSGEGHLEGGGREGGKAGE